MGDEILEVIFHQYRLSFLSSIGCSHDPDHDVIYVPDFLKEQIPCSFLFFEIQGIFHVSSKSTHYNVHFIPLAGIFKTVILCNINVEQIINNHTGKHPVFDKLIQTNQVIQNNNYGQERFYCNNSG